MHPRYRDYSPPAVAVGSIPTHWPLLHASSPHYPFSVTICEVSYQIRLELLKNDVKQTGTRRE